MSKELQAFKRIKDITYDRTDLYGIEIFREDLDIIEKSLKAFEIIKKKDFVDIKLLKQSHNMYEYNNNLAYRYSNTQRKNDICLIQNEEEYDLLKEVLL